VFVAVITVPEYIGRGAKIWEFAASHVSAFCDMLAMLLIAKQGTRLASPYLNLAKAIA
jgi:hypothetical protein